ncbi:hypothetical protein AAHZ94_20000, partial [Streptomyces sp. HSW2009]
MLGHTQGIAYDQLAALAPHPAWCPTAATSATPPAHRTYAPGRVPGLHQPHPGQPAAPAAPTAPAPMTGARLPHGTGGVREPQPADPRDPQPADVRGAHPADLRDAHPADVRAAPPAPHRGPPPPPRPGARGRPPPRPAPPPPPRPTGGARSGRS